MAAWQNPALLVTIDHIQTLAVLALESMVVINLLQLRHHLRRLRLDSNPLLHSMPTLHDQAHLPPPLSMELAMICLTMHEVRNLLPSCGYETIQPVKARGIGSAHQLRRHLPRPLL